MQGRTFNVGLIFGLFIVFAIVACSARPPRGDGVYGDLLQDPVSMDNTNMLNVNDGHPSAHLLNNVDDTPLAALQLQLLQQYANYNNMRNMPWEQFPRAPQDKRQIRYRQCYFNPISCFRK